MKCLLFDNYDSFTYNLRHMLLELGLEVDVRRNDRIALDEVAAYDRIVLSPGPGIPSEAGLLLPLIRRYAASKPILGICLGEQAIGEAFGARLENLAEVHHGVCSDIRVVADDPLFDGLGTGFRAGRYLRGWFRPRGSRLSGSHGHRPQRPDHGPAPQNLQPAGHPVPPRIGPHAAGQDDSCELDHEMQPLNELEP